MSGARVSIPVNGREIAGYLASPNVGAPAPGVIVLQEWWGLVPHIEQLCDRFASEGFVALAPDLYHGEIAKSPDEAGKLLMALDIAETEKDLRSATAFLLSQPAVTGDKAGVVGFCMGGQLALLAAASNPGIGACVDFYGVHPNVAIDLERMTCPVLGLFAEHDGPATLQMARRLEELGGKGQRFEAVVYPGAKHAFFNDTRPSVYDPSAAADAWRRVLEFLRDHLARA